MRTRYLIILALFVMVACGDGSGEDGSNGNGGSSSVDSPCELADAAMVQEVFGGTVAEGVEGPGRDCNFQISNGPVDNVQVFEFGPAEQFEGVRSGYEDNRGGTTDVTGVGDEAFYPGDVGPVTLVVKAGSQVFAVDANDAFAEEPPGTDQMVADLARAIAARLGG